MKIVNDINDKKAVALGAIVFFENRLGLAHDDSLEKNSMQDPEFWHQKWADNKIGFHNGEVHPFLAKYWSALAPKRHERVLVPLCGKSEDLVWLAERHDDVVGVELSPIAVRAFFAEHFYTPMVTQLSSAHELYQFDELSIYTGDFFTVPVETVDIVYDRAALVALPAEMRIDYAERVKRLLSPQGRLLVVTLDYSQDEMAGPPFSVDEQELQRLFSGYTLTLLESEQADEVHPKRVDKGLSRFAENVWLITAP